MLAMMYCFPQGWPLWQKWSFLLFHSWRNWEACTTDTRFLLTIIVQSYGCYKIARAVKASRNHKSTIVKKQSFLLNATWKKNVLCCIKCMSKSWLYYTLPPPPVVPTTDCHLNFFVTTTCYHLWIIYIKYCGGNV